MANLASASSSVTPTSSPAAFDLKLGGPKSGDNPNTEADDEEQKKKLLEMLQGGDSAAAAASSSSAVAAIFAGA